MRVARTLIGAVLLLAGVPAIVLAALGWAALRHGDDGVLAAHTHIRTEGRAVLVTDAAAFADSAAALPGSDRVRLTVRSASGPLLVALVPFADAARYLDGVARADVLGAGTDLRVVDVGGRAELAAPAQQAFWTTTGAGRDSTVDWAPRPGTALLVVRADGGAGVEATLGVGAYPWLGQRAWWLLIAGTAAGLAGLGLLLWPQRRREVVLVVEAHRMVDFADRIADRLGGPVATGRHPDVTGELVVLPRDGRDRYVNDPRRVTALDPNSDPAAAMREGTGESPYVGSAT